MTIAKALRRHAARATAFALLATLGAGAAHAQSASVWVADEKQVHRVDTALARITLSIPLEQSSGMALDKDGFVWVLGKKSLVRMAPDGAREFSADLKSLGLENAYLVATDPGDDRTWLADEKRVAVLDVRGTVLATAPLPSKPRSLATGLVGSAWILGQKELFRYDRQGALRETHDLRQAFQGEPKLLAVDTIGAWVWIAGEKRLVRLDLHGAAPSSREFALPKSAEFVAVDARTGDVWALGKGILQRFDDDGAPLASVDLDAIQIKEAAALAVEPGGARIWVAHKDGIAAFDPGGTRTHLVPAPRKVVLVATQALRIVPTLSIETPVEGALTSNARPVFSIAYGSTCPVAPCGFPNDFHSGFHLSALLGTTDLSPLFTFDLATGKATYAPAEPIADGNHVLRAQVADRFGSYSQAVERRFTIDTIAPGFLAVSPPDGSFLSSPAVTISGSTGEAAIITLAGDGISASTSGTGFAFPVTLRPGRNDFILAATDGAGNRSQAPLRLDLDNTPPVFTALAPANGSTASSAALEITGTVSEEATVTIAGDGISQSATGTGFSFAVTLRPGLNSFSLTATDAAGNSSTTSLEITLASGLQIAITSPAPGSTIPAKSATVTGTIEGSAGAGVTVNGVAAEVAAGQFSALVPVAPGPNTITATVTTIAGSQASQSISVTGGVPGPFEVKLSTLGGLSPLSTAVEVIPDGTRTIDLIVIYPQGRKPRYGEDDAPIYIYPPETRAEVMYWSTGAFPMVVEVRDTAGGVHEYAFTVMVTDIGGIEEMLRGIWAEFVAAMAAGDDAKAALFFNAVSRERYGPALAALRTRLPAIAQSITGMETFDITDRMGEFAVTRLQSGTDFVYFIYFLKDVDGVWRLDSM